MKKLSKTLLLFEDLLFILFIFLIPSQLAHHFWPNWAFVGGIRVDYYSPAIYLTDIIVFALLIVFVLRTVLTKGVGIRIKPFTLMMLGVLATLIIANIYYSLLPILSAMKWLKIIELTMIVLYIKGRNTFDAKKLLVMPLLYSVVVFGVIGIYQFYYQRSIGGLFYILGERSFTTDTVGIAVVNLFGAERLRMYSTFPHPNALAGYAGVVAILFFISYKKKIIKSNKALFWISILILGIVLFLTFSKTAYLSIIVVGCSYLLLKMNQQMFKKATKALFLMIVVLSFLFSIISLPVVNEERYKTVSERITLANVAGKAFSENIITGVGMNNYIFQLSQRDVPTNVRWLLQPVHNVYLLMLSEMGLLLFIIAVFALFKVLTMTIDKNSLLILPYLFILITGIFDHYWLTLQQNQLIATIVIAVIIREYYEQKSKGTRRGASVL